MSNQPLHRQIQEAVSRQLRGSGTELVDLIPIPAQGDRMVRLRTLEEAIQEFDRSGGESESYLIQIRPTRVERAQPRPTEIDPVEHREKGVVDGIYLSNGRLNLPYLFRNAELLIASGEWTLARNVYKTVLASGEHAAGALAGMGRCLEAEGKLEEARSKYDESIAYQASLESYRLLGSLLIRMGRDEKAGETFERALGMKEVTSSTRFELSKAAGNCFARAKRPADAERLYHRALEIDPSADDIRANLGALYLGANKTADARRHFQDALASNPRNSKALSGMGSCALAEGNKKAAHEHFAKSLEIELNNPTAIFHLVKTAYELKSYATAARLLGEYVQVAPVNTNLMYSLAGLQFHLGRLSEADTTVGRILEMSPGHAGAQELRALISRYSRTY